MIRFFHFVHTVRIQELAWEHSSVIVARSNFSTECSKCEVSSYQMKKYYFVNEGRVKTLCCGIRGQDQNSTDIVDRDLLSYARTPALIKP